MAKRDRPHECDTGFVTLFARTPQLCAGTLAGLGSALWLNIVGPFAGLVAAWGALVLVNALAAALVAALAMLVATAGTLLAADWRADVASHQAWAEMEFAAAELRLPARSVAPSQIDPRYLIATDSEALRNVFRAHRFTSLAPALEASTHRLAAATCATRMVEASDGPFPPVAALDAAPKVACKISTAASSDLATARSPHRKTSSPSFDQAPLVVATCRARPPISRAEPAASAARLVANGGAWSDWPALDRHVLTRPVPYGHIADIVVLSGDRGDRDQRFPGPSTSGGAGRGGEPPSCRGPPSAVSQRLRPTETVSAERSAEAPSKLSVAGRLQPANPIVRDNLGHHVPICAAELDVIS